MRIAGLLVCGFLLAMAGSAEADKVRANQRAELFARPGESSRILLHVDEGQSMTVLSTEGRWLKVRVKGRTGFVPRSKIDEDRGGRIDRNTRRRPFVDGRSRERGWAGGAPDDRVGADAVGDDDDDDDDRDRDRDRDDDDDDDRGRDRDDDDDDDRRSSRDDDDDDDDDRDRDRDRDDDDDDDEGSGRGRGDRDRDDDEEERPTVKVTAKRVTLYDRPSKKSEEMGTARKGDTFYFMREDGNWIMVENDEGDAVWIKSASVSRSGGGGASLEGRRIVGYGGAGVKLLGQNLRTPGAMNDMPPDNYRLGTSAATIAAGIEVMYPYGPTYRIGGSLEYAGSKAVPGVSYNGASTGLTIHDIDLRVIGGYDLKNRKGMVAYGRLGYHYENMAVANVSDFTKNTAMIPSEIFSGPVIGGGLDVANLTEKLSLRVILDAMVVGGKRKQTTNLEDGSSPSTKGAWLTGCLLYHWKPKMTINGAYELTYMNTSFGPQAPNSMRHPAGAGESSRRDLHHSVTVTVGYTF
jgi:hypothetical protein